MAAPRDLHGPKKPAGARLWAADGVIDRRGGPLSGAVVRRMLVAIGAVPRAPKPEGRG